MAPVPMPPIDLAAKKNKKIVFDDEGEIVDPAKLHKENKKKAASSASVKTEGSTKEENNDIGEQGAEEEEDYFAKRERLKRKHNGQGHGQDESQMKWFNVFPQYPSSNEVLDMKANEQLELFNLCKSSFESDLPAFAKRNPSDARWLQTALHKGTAKDRANAGALLVTSNPLGNLDALNNLIGFTKLSNRASPEVITILTDLWKEVLLPPQRKLVPLEARGADWRLVHKDNTLTKERQRRIYAYWYFEHQLKDHYFEFLKNLQEAMQKGQDNNKNISIVCASQLLSFAPEKEQMLLTMLVNKLGDPLPKIASKALHHLTEVAQRHANMCGVIVAETEKLLFRNNISDRAQHFSLCYLASVASLARPEVCNKLVHICFGLFKVLVQKGAVNSRTMQAILRCLQKAIADAKPAEGSENILSKEMQDTVYRLVHLADIRIAVQTLGLLLQLLTVKTEKSDRFYNALYKKMHDLELANVGTKTAAQLLHIIHRAIHLDDNVPRSQAFIKRLLQLSLYLPSHVAAGCLIVIYKLQKSRKDLMSSNRPAGQSLKIEGDSAALDKFDSDGEEKYEDVEDSKEATDKKAIASVATSASWHHSQVSVGDKDQGKVKEMAPTHYDPYHRTPAFAGAEFSLRNELLLLRDHYHPTVQVFADSIMLNKRIDYYGDPLRDFGLPHFLERFAFKNPKKLDNQKAETTAVVAHKRYSAHGARGLPVQSLTRTNCTEDEMYIFNYLEHKRNMAAINKGTKPSKKSKDKGSSDEDDDGDEGGEHGLKPGEVDDDEFEAYLDGFFGKKAKAAADAEDAAAAAAAGADSGDDDEELDFLQELGGELKQQKANKKKKSKARIEEEEDDDDEHELSDWDDNMDEDEEDALEDGFEANSEQFSDDEDGSIDLDDEDDEGSVSFDEDDSQDEADGSEDGDDDEEPGPPKSKKSRKTPKALDEKGFAKKLKRTDDMSSLFAAADDFAEMLEETGKTKGQGTTNVIFNKDKSSDKQMKWEEKRHSNAKSYKGKKKSFGGAGGGGRKFPQKRKNKH